MNKNDDIVCVTSSRIFPSASKLSPGQAAYHFLAGYQNGKFVPAFHKGPSSIDPLELAKALLCMVKLESTCLNKLIFSWYSFLLTRLSAYIIMAVKTAANSILSNQCQRNRKWKW